MPMCNSCNWLVTIGGRSRCNFYPPTMLTHDDVAAYPVIESPSTWTCGQHSSSACSVTIADQPVAVTLTNALRANLGTVTVLAGAITLPTVTGTIRKYDYFRVPSTGTFLGTSYASGDLIMANQDSPSSSTAGHWLKV